MKGWVFALVAVVHGLGCAGQVSEQSRQLAEMDRRIRSLEAERDASSARVQTLEAKLAGPRQVTPNRGPEQPAGQTPMLRVVRLSPELAVTESGVPTSEESSPGASEDSNAEHVVLSGSGSQLRSETLTAEATPATQPKVKP